MSFACVLTWPDLLDGVCNVQILPHQQPFHENTAASVAPYQYMNYLCKCGRHSSGRNEPPDGFKCRWRFMKVDAGNAMGSLKSQG